MWEQYAIKVINIYIQVDGIIFVIDSADKLRFSVAADEFNLLLET